MIPLAVVIIDEAGILNEGASLHGHLNCTPKTVPPDRKNVVFGGSLWLPTGRKLVADNVHAPDNAARLGAVPGRWLN